MMMRLSADDVEPQSLPAGIVLRRGPLPTLVNKDGKLELHSLLRLQPVQLSEEWGDMVVPRRRKHQPSSSVHHRLEPIELVVVVVVVAVDL